MAEPLDFEQQLLEGDQFQQLDKTEEQGLEKNFQTTEDTTKPKPSIIDNAFVNAINSTPGGASGEFNPKIVPKNSVKQYLDMPYGYRYGLDNSTFYGDQEHWLKTAGKGVFRFGLGTTAKVGQGVGFLLGLSNPMNWDADFISNVADNGISKVFEQLDQKTKEDWFPLYQEAEDREKGFWNRLFTDGDFWAEDIADGAAFMASVFVPGMALSKLGLGAKLLRLGSGLRWGTGIAEDAVVNAGKVQNYLTRGAQIAKTIDKTTLWATSTASEALFEAAEVKRNIINSLTYDEYGNFILDPETNLPYTEEQKKRIAGQNAKSTFLLNTALLGLTNIVQLRWLGKIFNEGAELSTKNIIGTKTLLDKLSSVEVTGKLSKFLDGRVGKFFSGAPSAIASEGFIEENFQLAIQRLNEKYGKQAKVRDVYNVSELLKQVGNQTLDAIIGEDPTASVSIGLGGFLGSTMSGAGEVINFSKEKLNTESLITAYNNSQQNWLKFGNIYKTQLVDAVDDKGNPTKVEKVLFDETGKPVEDSDKVSGILSGYRGVTGALDESDLLDKGIMRDVMRDKAFADFVKAHIDAGLEDTLLQKLDDVTKASPEEIVKLGFVLDDTVNDQINKYKNLASKIIKQNKLINRDILFDNTPEDLARKNALTQLAAEQAVYENLANEVAKSQVELKNELINSNNTSLSDSLVDQLNDLTYRIISQKEKIGSIKNKESLSYEIASGVLTDLETNLANVLKSNELSLKTIKKGKNGFYKYEKNQRNRPGIAEQYIKKTKLKSEIENTIDELGYEWSKYADAINGKKNFLKSFIEEVEEPLKEAVAKKELEEKILASKPKTVSETIKDDEGNDVIVSFSEKDIFTLYDKKSNKTQKIEVESINYDNKQVTVIGPDGKPITVPIKDFSEILFFEKWKLQKPKEQPKPKSKEGEDPSETEEELFTEVEDGKLTAEEERYAQKPKFEEVGFGKTFGRQYDDPPVNTIPNTENGSDRFYYFTAKHNVYNRYYFLKVVTADNDEFKIRDSKYNPDDIKVVLMKRTKTGEDEYRYDYVDKDNNIIPEGTATKDNIIYRSLIDINNLDIERVKKDYTTGALTDAEIQKAIDEHIAFQKDLVKRVKGGEEVFLKAVTTSPGVQTVMYSSELDEKGNKIPAEQPLEGRIITRDPDFDDLRSANNPDINIALRVATADNVPAQGIRAGRLIMQEYTIENGRKIWGDNIYRVFNRKLTDFEKETVYKAFLRLSDLFIKKYGKKNFFGKNVKKSTKLSKEEEAELNLINTYLKGVINWSKPKSKEKVSDKNFWISNGLHRGSTVIPLDRANITKNKENLTKGVYHNVNSTLLKEDKSFTTIKFNKSGEASKDVKYDTYTEYLLAKREKGSSPVYTSLPLANSETPQRTNAYIKWKEIGVKEDIKEETVEKEEKISTGLPTIDKEIDEFVSLKRKYLKIKGVEFKFTISKDAVIFSFKSKGFEQKTEPIPLSEVPKRRNDLIQVISRKTGHKYGATAAFQQKTLQILEQEKKRKEQEAKKKAEEEAKKKGSKVSGSKNKIDIETKRKKELSEFNIGDKVNRHDSSGKFQDVVEVAEVRPNQIRFKQPDGTFINKNIDQLNFDSKSTSTASYRVANFDKINATYDTELAKELYREMKAGKVVTDMTSAEQQVVDKYLTEELRKLVDAETITPEGTSEVTAEGPFFNIDDAVQNAVVKDGVATAVVSSKNINTGEIVELYRAEVKIVGGNMQLAKRELSKKLLSQIDTVGDDEAPFRLALEEEASELEEFDNFQNFMQENLPQIPVKRINNLIFGKAWGGFLRGAIYIYNKAGKGTGYHEAFESVWASYLTDEEQVKLIEEFRQREGSFKNPYSGITKTYAEATKYDVREMLADEFASYVEDEAFLPKTTGEKTKNIFQKLWDFIKKIFGLTKNERKELNGKINSIFKKISKGGYKNARAIRDVNTLSPAYKTAPGLNQQQTLDALEGINFNFFKELFLQGNTVDSIIRGLDKKAINQLLTKTFDTAFDQVVMKANIVNTGIATVISEQKKALYEIFKANLKRYGISFFELEDQDESTTNDPLGIRDSITIDPRKTTSVNVSLLLLSLPDIRTVGGKIKHAVNDLGQPKLVDSSRVHTLLLNELSNISFIVKEDGTKLNAFDQMIEKLDQKYKKKDGTYREGYHWINSLKIRLKYQTPTGEKIPTNTLDKDDINLRVAFIKSFSNTKFIPDKMIVESDGLIYNFNPLINVNEDRIRKDWANNIKKQLISKKSKLFKLQKSGRYTVDQTSDDYFMLVDQKDAGGIEPILEGFRKLGIEFSASAQELTRYETTLREEYIQIVNQFENKTITDLEDLFAKNVIGGRIDALIGIETKFEGEDNVLSYYNADGEIQYSVGNPSLFGTTINILNKVNSLEELVRTAPWLGFIDSDGKAQLHPYQANSILLKPGGVLFGKDGKRKRASKDQELTYRVISGTGVSNVDGTNTAKLQFPERVALKIHYLLNNIGCTLINSDKSTEFGLSMPKKAFIEISDIDNFFEDNDKKIINIYVDQLKDELAAAVFQKSDPINIQYYSKGVFDLGHFRDIISDKIKQQFKDEILNEDSEDFGEYEKFVEKNFKSIEKDIATYLKSKIEDTYDFLLENDIFYKPGARRFWTDLKITDAIDNELLNEVLGIDPKTVKDRDGYSKEDIMKLAGYLAINEEISVTEQHKIVYGHPAMYKDLPKRANGPTSTKEALVEDSDIIFWQDENMPRNDGKKRSEDVNQITKVVSFKDMDVVSIFYKEIAEGIYKDLRNAGLSQEDAEKKVGAKFNESNELTGFILDKGDYTGAVGAYLKLTESDAMAMGMPDAIRDLLFASGKFTDERSSQWDYEIAYEKLVRSGTIENKKGETIKKGNPAYKKYSKAELADALSIYNAGDPGYVFEVLKPQYFGYGVTKNVSHPVFLKHAVQPKFYRHIEGTQFEKIYIASQNKQVDIIGFESGEKVGNVTTDSGDFVPTYNELGEANTIIVEGRTKDSVTHSFTEDMPIQEVYSRFYGIQVEQNNKPKKSVIRGTQVTKIIMTNFYENGLPITPEIGELIEDYNNTLTSLIQLGKQGLLKELGLKLEYDPKEKADVYKAKDLSKLIKLLRAEAESRDLPDNIIEAIDYIEDVEKEEQELLYSFDTIITREKIDNILNSIVNSRVISEKVNGKSSPQVASTLYESNPRSFTYLKNGVYTPLSNADLKTLTEDQRKSIKMTSSDLKFYRKGKDGKTLSMEVYISWPFGDEVTPEEMGLKLENGIYKIPEGGLRNIDKEVLRILGFRIPTQASNSIESIIIKGFTPATNGDMIVVPSEIVGKSGSDFDIDKLNLYMPNVKVDVNGERYYGEPEFNDFLYNNLINRGLSEDKAKEVINTFTKEDYLEINSATFTEAGKYQKNAELSLDDISKRMEASGQTLEYIKKGIQAYNLASKNRKYIKYIPEDTTTKAGLQNRLIRIMSELVLSPENYVQLITPNSTATLKSLATRVSRLETIANPDKAKQNEKSPTYLRTFIGTTQTRERYLTAKQMVGISALHSTFHAMAQKSGLKINAEYKTKNISYLIPKEKEEKKEKGRKKTSTFITKKTEPIVIKLPHHGADEKTGLFSIGYKRAVNGQDISEMNSESTSGFVDGAKDPFVFDLKLSMNNASTWFYLRHLGVPENYIAALFSQPIIADYFKNFAKNRSNFKKQNGNNLSREELMFETVAPYYDKVVKGGALLATLASIEESTFSINIKNERKNDILKQLDVMYNTFDEFSISQLEEAISKGENADPKLQIAALLSYLRYNAQAGYLSSFMDGIKFDTGKTATTQESILQMAKWEKAKKQGFINNPEAIMDNTFLGELQKQKADVFNMFRTFFITLSPDVQNVFEKLYEKLEDPDTFLMRDDAYNLITRYQNHVLGYILHTTPFKTFDGTEKTLNEMYEDMFKGDNSIAKRLSDLKNSKDYTISENLFIKELMPLLTNNDAKTNNISLFRNRLDTFEINSVVESLKELDEYADSIGDDSLKKDINDIILFSILQSGLQNSNIDYRKVLSVELYSETLKNIFDSFKNNNITLDAQQVWRTFHQNNWNNRGIVSKAPAWLKVKGEDGTISVGASSAMAKVEYFVKYVKREDLSREEIKKLQKEKRGFEAFAPVLYENSQTADDKGRIVFFPINKLGDGPRFLEIYADPDTKSILEENDHTKIAINKKSAMKPGGGWFKVSDLLNKTKEEKDIDALESEEENNMPNVEVEDNYYTSELLKANPDKIYVFGDNNQREGKKGQASVRDEPNAMGISTKLKPSTNKDAYMTDESFDKNKEVIDSDIAKIIETNKTIVFPKAGLGTGLAKLKEKAPKTYAYLKQRLLQEFGFDNDTGTISQPAQVVVSGKKTIKEFKVGEQVQDNDYNVWKIISQKEYEKESKIGNKAGVKVRFITNINPNENRKQDFLNPDSTTYIEPNSVNTVGENTLVQGISETTLKEGEFFKPEGSFKTFAELQAAALKQFKDQQQKKKDDRNNPFKCKK